ncbi:hypothetical protein PFISCL1PPCAC_25191, partial [Pristionchus fissidentatus]
PDPKLRFNQRSRSGSSRHSLRATIPHVYIREVVARTEKTMHEMRAIKDSEDCRNSYAAIVASIMNMRKAIDPAITFRTGTCLMRRRKVIRRGRECGMVAGGRRRGKY